MGDPFDVIPFDDIKGGWSKLGSGSFGNVYKGSYLGIDVAIKEVLPSTEYDVAKYFEREWRLLKESRHPNVVLYLGLSRAPEPDARIFIISEFIENGNLRQYIYDKSKPLPWRLRLSFATDIARALAYLHARKCIHRDLKGENLLLTANGRLKITDFGFARIAARNQEESRRLTFCGTDAYMSPEILLGYEFDLPTDIFSLGIILAEIAARRLADDTHFARSAPSFTVDNDEVCKLASPGCPPEFIQLAIDCIAEDPAARPTTLVILERLRAIEAEVLARPEEAEVHTGSIKFMTGNRRPLAPPRIPSFGEGIGKGIRTSSTQEPHLSEEESDDELSDAVSRLESVTIIENGVPLASRLPAALFSLQGVHTPTTAQASFVDILHNQPTQPSLPSPLSSQSAHPQVASNPPPNRPLPAEPERHSAISMASYYTASEEDASSIAAATEGGSSLAPALVHRFTLVKPGTIFTKRSRPASPSGSSSSTPGGGGGGWSALDFFFASGLLPGGGGGAKCDICAKRLGRKAALECDDCGLRAHIKCGEVAPRDLRAPGVVDVDPDARLLGTAARAGQGQ
ncbi:kinase-like domain-containing protein [Lactarius akahatsu]|uniref:Kinase-like domain-containing protein n=1 Tax=Lactarius akahatsu TaxID=416441 RepID=A0AAD4QEN1_9AGAM|nr:kinase-like domain-containing protein [Lactarius akahatsu]